MPLTFTTQVQAGANSNRFNVTSWDEGDDGINSVTLEALRTGGNPVWGAYVVRFSNAPGESQKIARTTKPSGAEDFVVPGHWGGAPEGLSSGLLAAMDAAGGTRAAKKRAILQHGLDTGWIDASLTGVVT